MKRCVPSLRVVGKEGELQSKPLERVRQDTGYMLPHIISLVHEAKLGADKKPQDVPGYLVAPRRNMQDAGAFIILQRYKKLASELVSPGLLHLVNYAVSQASAPRSRIGRSSSAEGYTLSGELRRPSGGVPAKVRLGLSDVAGSCSQSACI